MESKVFNDDLDERLIELVRMHSVLYHIGHPKYKDNEYKRKVWKNIAFNLGKTPTQCKTRWRTIRDSYKKAQKRITKTGRKGYLATQSKSKYNTANLKFLDDIFNLRELRATRDFNALQHRENQTHDSSFEYPDRMLDANMDNFIKKSDEEDASDNERRNRKRPMIVMVDDDHHHHLTKRASAQSDLSPENSQKSTYTKEQSMSSQDSTPNSKSEYAEHPIETFFRSMAKTVMAFPPHLIAETRMKVCQLVSEMEIRALSEQNLISCGAYYDFSDASTSGSPKVSCEATTDDVTDTNHSS